MCEEHAVYHPTRQYTSPSVAPKHDHRVLPQKKEKKSVLHLVDFSKNALSANPTKGHLSVVGWTSTQPLGRFGKPPNYFQGENLLGGETREDIY